MKERLFVLIKVILFTFLFLLIFQRISLVVQVYGTEEDSPDRRNCLFFSLPKNTVDCMFAGTSHVYCTFIPQQIYDESGITSASAASSSQSFENTYWILKEALKTQSPKVFVMDIHNISAAVDEKVQNFRLHHTSGISSLPDTSINKWKEYNAMKENGIGWAKNISAYDVYSFFEYRGEYNRGEQTMLRALDIFCSPEKQYKTFGFYATTTVTPLTSLSPHKENSSIHIDLESTREFEYLKKIKDLTDENDIQLLLVRSPYDAPELDDGNLMNQTIEWASKNQIDFIDYFDLMDELNINLTTDFRDGDHLNYIGAKKATSYFTKYLKEHYALTDHRGDSTYALWERREFDYSEREAIIQKTIQKK